MPASNPASSSLAEARHDYRRILQGKVREVEAELAELRAELQRLGGPVREDRTVAAAPTPKRRGNGRRGRKNRRRERFHVGDVMATIEALAPTYPEGIPGSAISKRMGLASSSKTQFLGQLEQEGKVRVRRLLNKNGGVKKMIVFPLTKPEPEQEKPVVIRPGEGVYPAHEHWSRRTPLGQTADDDEGKE